MKRRAHRLILPVGLLIGIALTALYVSDLRSPNGGLLTWAEHRWIDAILASRGTQVPSGKVVIAAIDAKSIDRYGRWPWSRARLADLVDTLSGHYQARLIGFDIIISEPGDIDVRTALQSLQQDVLQLSGISPGARRTLQKRINEEWARYGGDDRLARALNDSGRVLLGAGSYGSPEAVGHLAVASISQALDSIAAIRLRAEPPTLRDGFVPTSLALELPLAPLIRSSRSIGLLTVIPDRADGKLRRAHLVTKVGNHLYPSLALELYRLRRQASEVVMEVNRHGVVGALRVGGDRIETGEDGSIWLNYRGRQRAIKHLSVADLMERKVPTEAVSDRIVVVGATDVGLGDRHVTPVDIAYPGVEVHATAVDNLVVGDYFRYSFRNDQATVGLILLVSGVMALLVRSLPLRWSLAIWVVSMVSYTLLHRWLVIYVHTWTAYLPVLLAIGLTGAFAMSLRLWGAAPPPVGR